jgi:oligopeptide transport system substrate-binding protein
MKHNENKLFPSHQIRFRGILPWTLVLLFLLIISGCESSLTDVDRSGTPTPVETPGEVTEQPQRTEATPEAFVEERGDGWSVITGRDRQDPPDDRSSDQVFRMAGPSDAPTTIDPALVRDTSSAFLSRQVFRGLVKLDSELKPVPDLAYQIEIDPNGRLYRVTLHENISFHDGTTITADHVKASFERATDPALTDGDGEHLPSRNYLDDIEGARERMDGERDDIPGIVVIDERTLEVSLERGVVDFLERLANPSALIVDAEQAAEGGDWWQNPNGTGPFMLVEWDPERQVTLEAHDGYVIPPSLAQVEVRLGAEAVGQMQLYETDQIDYVGVPLSVLDRVQYEDSPIAGDLRQEALLSTSFVMINSEIAPYDQQELREAIMLTLPRDQLTEIMLEGRVPTAEGILPPDMAGSEVGRFPFDHEPDQAGARFAEVENSESLDQVTIYSSGGGIPVVMKHFIEQELDVPVEVVQLRWSDYMSDMEDGLLSIFVLSWVADGPDPASFLRALFHSESPDNYARYSDPEVDQILDQVAIEQDDQRRIELLQQAHERILESAVVMPLYHGVDYVLVADHVRGLETTSMGILGLETVWIEN